MMYTYTIEESRQADSVEYAEHPDFAEHFWLHLPRRGQYRPPVVAEGQWILRPRLALMESVDGVQPVEHPVYEQLQSVCSPPYAYGLDDHRAYALHTPDISKFMV